jgi:hypothetical protein
MTPLLRLYRLFYYVFIGIDGTAAATICEAAKPLVFWRLALPD